MIEILYICFSIVCDLLYYIYSLYAINFKGVTLNALTRERSDDPYIYHLLHFGL